MSPEEIFDVVDENDNVIGQAPRSQVHARGLLHRAVHVFVFDTQGRLLLQKRSATKDEFPLCYTSSSSGHLNAGESYDEAAPRELEEELGLQSPIEFLTKLPASLETANEHTALYRAVTDEVPKFHLEEIESGQYLSLQAIADMIDDNPDEFSPPLRALFHWYVESRE